MKIVDYLENIIPTQDQVLTLNHIQTFLDSRDSEDHIFMLKGYAGSGKTTILKSISHYLAAKHQSVKLIAPTGRAALILEQKTQCPASTIHRLIYDFSQLVDQTIALKKEGRTAEDAITGLDPVPEGKTGKTEKLELATIVEEKGSKMHYYFKISDNEDSIDTVYLVDESSMISDHVNRGEFMTFGSGRVLRDLIRYIAPYTRPAKVIFIGDDAQLPPVDMNFSPALHEDYIREEYQLRVSVSTLKNVVRQSQDSGILIAATQLRESIEANIFNRFSLDQSQEDIEKVKGSMFKACYQDVVKSDGLEQLIVLTHSNRLAQSYNNMIREIRYGQSYVSLRVPDQLMITRNSYTSNALLLNGMLVTIEEVGEVIYTATPSFRTKFSEVYRTKLTFREVVIRVKDQSLKTMIIEELLTSEEGKLSYYDQMALYIDFKNRMSKLKIHPKSTQFNQRLREDPFFNALQVKYGYAITCHKAQGGEWKNVIIDFDVFMNFNSSSFFHWAYTALTRSSQKIYALNAPEMNAMSSFVVKPIMSCKPLKKMYYRSKDTFVDDRKKRLEKLCEAQNIVVSFTEHNYQLLSRYSKAALSNTQIYWYGKAGFGKVEQKQRSGDEDFDHLINKLALESLIPEHFEWYAVGQSEAINSTEGPSSIAEHKLSSVPDRINRSDKAERNLQRQMETHEGLYHELKEIFDELGVVLTNVIQEPWKDEYFFLTQEAQASLSFHYNKKNIFTSVVPQSTKGEEDTLLQQIVTRLKGDHYGF